MTRLRRDVIFECGELDNLLAVLRLRQWCVKRGASPRGRPACKQRGRVQRNNAEANAHIVFVIDFERALAKLAGWEVALLLMIYRDGHSMEQAAEMLGCCLRTVGYLLPKARRHLKEVLDAMGLL
jgi:DNA-directed RNA polymerase specialized sigma24 family protein